MYPFKYLINTEDRLDELIEVIKDQSIFAYDTETNGTFNRFQVQMVGMSLCFDDLLSVYLPFNHLWDDTPQLFLDSALEKLAPFFLDEDIRKIAHNAKFDEMVLGRYDLEVKGPGDDTFVTAWLLQEDRVKGGKSLKRLAQEEYRYRMMTYEEVIMRKFRKKKDRDFSFAPVPPDKALAYAADDSYFTWRLYHDHVKRVIDEGLWSAYENIDRPFNRVIKNVEAVGVSLNHDYIEYADKRLPELIDKVEGEIYEEVGRVFDIGSPKQLGHVLFEELKIAGDQDSPRTATGQYKTDKKTLDKYASKSSVVKNVLKRKKLQKTHSTFVTGLKKCITEDGKVHASFNGCGTVTGRLSSGSPNLQQVEGGDVEGIKPRNFFVPSDGYLFVVADYSQIELRMMAHFSKDRKMIEAFLSGKDYHDETARNMLKIPDDKEVDRKSRVIAKTLNFGVGYGRGAGGIAEQIGCSISTAENFIADYFTTFSTLAAYKEELLKRARRDGFIRTISGRKRRLLPEIRSNNWFLRGGAERQAFNTKMQGSAADIIKLAMISLEPKLNEIGARMCIQIHDELVTEVPTSYADEGVKIMKETMENPLKGKNPLCLPLVTEPTIVESWGDAK